jgi:hypothetical protein
MTVDTSTADLAPEAEASTGGLGASVAVAKMSSKGLPLIVFSNGAAFCFQPQMKVWLKVWDIHAPVMAHQAGPSLPFALSTNQGDLSTIQAEAQKQQGPRPPAQLMIQAALSNATALMHHVSSHLPCP